MVHSDSSFRTCGLKKLTASIDVVPKLQRVCHPLGPRKNAGWQTVEHVGRAVVVSGLPRCLFFIHRLSKIHGQMVEHCIHIANLFYLASYLCRDILWLRVITCCGLLFGIAFFCGQNSDSMLAPATWMSVFLVVNLGQIAWTVVERYRNRLTLRQEWVSDLMLTHLTRDELLSLLTKSMCGNRTDPELLRDVHQLELDADERIVRDLAFSKLSNRELGHLLTRRFWRSFRRRRTSKIRSYIVGESAC